MGSYSANKSFSSGEISPSLYSRVDLVRYATGLKTCRNWIVNVDGSASVRPGSEYIVPVLDFGSGVNRNIRLVPFYVDDINTYVLVMMNSRIVIIKNDAYITEAAKTISAMTNASPGVFTSAAHGFSTNDFIYLEIDGPDSLSDQYYRVTTLTSNTFSLSSVGTTTVSQPVDTTSLPAFVSGTASRVYNATPGIGAGIPDETLPFLRYAQDGSTLTFTTGGSLHSNCKIGDLTRTTDTNWTLDYTVYAPSGPSIDAPTNATITTSSTGSVTSVQYAVTAINNLGEESFPSNKTSSVDMADLTAGAYARIQFDDVSGAVSYNIYRIYGGIYGLIGSTDDTGAGTHNFDDIGYTPDFSITPPLTDDFQDFGTSTIFVPSSITYHQQRLMLGGGKLSPPTVLGSRPGFHLNFTYSFPSREGDGIQFDILSYKRPRAIHMLSADDLFVFTANAEYLISGDQANILRPTALNSRQISAFGASPIVAPMLIGSSPIFVQASSGKVFELDYLRRSSVSGGIDLNTFSSHLVNGYTILDWTFQSVPQTDVWMARSDGKMLCCSYDKDQNILAWSRHDTDGVVQNVVSIPGVPEDYTGADFRWPIASSTFEDSLYMVVGRTPEQGYSRYIEKLSNRSVSDITDVIRMDSALSFDGTNTTSTTMTFTGGTTWDYGETLTLTASSSFFTSDSVGNEVHFESEDGTEIRFSIQAFVSGTEVTGMVDKLLPTDLRNVAIEEWGYAVDEFSGLSHLEGKDVSIFADGYVVGSPNNSAYPVYTVTDGSVTIPTPAVKVHIGLPYLADIETLDIDTVEGEPVADRKQLVTNVSFELSNTRGLFVGPEEPTGSDPLEHLTEMKLDGYIEYDDPIALLTGKASVTIQANWSQGGSVFIRQADPLPATLVGITPTGIMSFGGAR